jgi:hypothetical protein
MHLSQWYAISSLRTVRIETELEFRHAKEGSGLSHNAVFLLIPNYYKADRPPFIPATMSVSMSRLVQAGRLARTPVRPTPCITYLPIDKGNTSHYSPFLLLQQKKLSTHSPCSRLVYRKLAILISQHPEVRRQKQ